MLVRVPCRGRASMRMRRVFGGMIRHVVCSWLACQGARRWCTTHVERAHVRDRHVDRRRGRDRQRQTEGGGVNAKKTHIHDSFDLFQSLPRSSGPPMLTTTVLSPSKCSVVMKRSVVQCRPHVRLTCTALVACAFGYLTTASATPACARAAVSTPRTAAAVHRRAARPVLLPKS